jgi:hypothetical protein
MLLPKLPSAIPVQVLFSMMISRAVSKLCSPPPNQMRLLRMIPPELATVDCPEACLPPLRAHGHSTFSALHAS